MDLIHSAWWPQYFLAYARLTLRAGALSVSSLTLVNMKIFNLLAVFLSSVQIVVIVYFLLKYHSDNMPFFILLIAVPAVSIFALLFENRK